jgi:hypothetical protein
MRTRVIVALLPVLYAPGCSGGAASATPEDVAQDQAPVYGFDNYGTDCSAGEQQLLNQTMLYGRIASASAAFAQCMTQTVQSTYRKCQGDPWFSSPLSTQLAAALNITDSANDVTINCTGGAGNASAVIGTYGTTSPEALSFGGWLSAAFTQLSLPVCNGSNGPNCRFAPYPWPYSQAAGIIWHEASHNQGYTHGANDQADAIAACGYAGDPSWNFQVNTMPYLIGNCMSAVLDQSGSRCMTGSTLETCGPAALSLVDGYNSSTCTCVSDPSPRFAQVPGCATSLGVGPGGQAWMIGCSSNGLGGNGIFQLQPSGWVQVPGAATQITVSPEGTPWLINSGGYIFKWNGTWINVPGCATSLGVGPNGQAWIIGCGSNGTGGNGIFQLQPSGWVQVPGAATRIAVSPEGTPWVINSGGVIFKWNGSQFTGLDVPGCGTSLGVGPNGQAWVIGCASDGPAGNGIFRLTPSGWSEVLGAATQIAVSPEGTPWVVNSGGYIFQ